MSATLNARTYGPDTGPPLVLLHELGGSSASFRWLVPELADMRAIAVDHPGSGESALLDSAASGLADHAEAVWSFLREEVREPVRILGIAFGAALGAIIAARHPDAVSGLVYCCMGSEILDRTQRFLRERSARVEREGIAPVVDMSLERSFPEVLRRGREAVFAEYARDLASSGVTGYIRQSLALAAADSVIADSLKCVRAPVAVVGGSHDGHFTPAAMRMVGDLVPNLIAAVTIEDAAHLPHIQAPRRLAAVVRELMPRMAQAAT